MKVSTRDGGDVFADGEFIPFALPDLGEEEAAAVSRVIGSGWITSGREMKAFEEEFSSFIGGGVSTVAVNSATAGLHLALEAIGVGPGDEVIVPTWTFTATAEVVRYLGATPVLVDVDDDSLNMSIEFVSRCVTDRTKAVIPVHFAGLAVDIPSLREALGGADVRIIEDAAHALPSIGSDGLVGACNTSDAAVFSFYATKTMTTGEGGMIATRDVDLAERARVMRLHGIDRPAFDRYTSTAPAWRYDVVAPGFKYNMTDAAAAMGRVQLGRLQEMADRRSAIADYYTEHLRDLPLVLPLEPGDGNVHAWHLYVVRRRPECPRSRDEIVDALARAGVGASVHYIPLHQHSYWQTFAPSASSRPFPVAESASHEAFSIPIYSAMSDAQVTRVAESLHQVLM